MCNLKNGVSKKYNIFFFKRRRRNRRCSRDWSSDVCSSDLRPGPVTGWWGRAMDVGEAIRSQRAISRFADRPIAGEVLEEILDAARRAPSSMNEQRWAFVLVTDPERLRALASVGEDADHLAGAAPP